MLAENFTVLLLELLIWREKWTIRTTNGSYSKYVKIISSHWQWMYQRSQNFKIEDDFYLFDGCDSRELVQESIESVATFAGPFQSVKCRRNARRRDHRWRVHWEFVLWKSQKWCKMLVQRSVHSKFQSEVNKGHSNRDESTIKRV